MTKLIHAIAIIFALSPVTHPLAWWVHAWAFLLIYHCMTIRDPSAILFDTLQPLQRALWNSTRHLP